MIELAMLRNTPRVASLLVAAATLGAQGAANATLAFELPGSARTVSMGNIGIVGRDDDVIFYNPAMLVVARVGTSATGAVQGRRRGVMQPHLKPGLREGLRNAAAHGSRADDTDGPASNQQIVGRL